MSEEAAVGGKDTKSVAAVEDLRGLGVESLRHEKDMETVMSSSIVVGVEINHTV